jgi:hypothetical protein
MLKVKIMSLLARISVVEVLAAADNVWFDKSIADTIASATVQTINQTYVRNFMFFSGKSSKYLIGGLFYLLGYRYGVIKNQNEIADRLGTTDVTIRISYRKWLETFPDMFLDVIGKFADNSSLRSFVLLDLKRSWLQSENKRVRCLPSAI